MIWYNSTLPKFTAKSSLLTSNARYIPTHSPDDYHHFAESRNTLTMAQPNCIQNSWCKNTCNPATGEGENCCWRSDIRDCVCTSCRQPLHNCCGKPLGYPCP